MHSIFLQSFSFTMHQRCKGTSHFSYNAFKMSFSNKKNNPFSRLSARLWNEIPHHLRDLTKKSFKARITKYAGQRKCLSSDPRDSS